MGTPVRCVLLFARSPGEEALAKGLGRDGALFEFARRRICAAVAALDDVDLIVPDQRGRSFGERLVHAFETARSLGYREIVAVPTDAPALGAGDLEDAFDALRTHDLILGPSSDGGVYLIGMTGRARAEELFPEVKWCTGSVAADLLRIFPAAAVLTRVISDIDKRADIGRLARETTLDPELAALLHSLRTPRGVRRHEAALPPRVRPAGVRAARAPPAHLSLA